MRSSSLLAANQTSDLTDADALARSLNNMNSSALDSLYNGGGGAAPAQLPLSYLLSATNYTLVPLLEAHAAVHTHVPLLVYITTNVTVCCPAPAPRGLLPMGGLHLNRPVVFVGCVEQPTSMDFRLQASTLNMTEFDADGTQYAIAWDSMVLENLPHGDASSISIAQGNNLDFRCACVCVCVCGGGVGGVRGARRSLDVCWCLGAT
jgi:hypothetical protein